MRTMDYPILGEEKLGMDFKQFVQEFETFRHRHNDQSVQQALNYFVEQKQQEQSTPELALV